MWPPPRGPGTSRLSYSLSHSISLNGWGLLSLAGRGEKCGGDADHLVAQLDRLVCRDLNFDLPAHCALAALGDLNGEAHVVVTASGLHQDVDVVRLRQG